jgi:DNA-directed RNA polymerase subunit RPC12/RpoP
VRLPVFFRTGQSIALAHWVDVSTPIDRTFKMKIICPHCEHEEEDAFEVLELDTLHDDFRCARCGNAFAAYLNDCIRCGAEQAFEFKAAPSAAAISSLTCAACGYKNSENSGHDGDEHDAFS